MDQVIPEDFPQYATVEERNRQFLDFRRMQKKLGTKTDGSYEEQKADLLKFLNAFADIMGC